MTSSKPPVRTPTPPANQQSIKKVSFGTIHKAAGQRVVIYGTGGIGKSTLACLAPGPVAFIDADESLPILRSQLEGHNIPLPLPVEVNGWRECRDALKSSGWDKIKTIVIDTVTKLEEWCLEYTLQTVPHESGRKVSRIEDYGFGKGYRHVFDTWRGLLGDLDSHSRAGRNVILIAHEATSTVPNPRGEDYLRYEPRLQDSKAASIKHKMKEWADHLLFLGYDVVVDDKGVAQGSGTRTLYTSEMPFCMAKSRTTNEQFDILLGESPWENIIK